MLDQLSNAPWSRLFAASSLIISLLFYREIIDKFQLYFNLKLIIENKEFWRPFTSLFCFGSFSLNAVLAINNFIQYCTQVECSFFPNRPAEFLLFCLFGWSIMWIIASYYPIPFLGISNSYYFMYYLCKRNPDQQLRLMVLPIPLSSSIVPYVILALSSSEGMSSIIPLLLGYGAAHLYFFIVDCLGLKYNINILKLPSAVNQFLFRLLN